MNQSEEHQRVEAFLELLQKQEQWLDEAFPSPGSDNVGKMAKSLREYLGHCRTQAKSGDNAPKKLNAWRRRIEQAAWSLFKAAGPRK